MKLIELTNKLLSFDTVSQTSSNLEMANFISNFLEGKGFKIEQYPYISSNKLEKVNVIARKSGNKSHLALSGHMDTVPFKKWTVDSSPLKLHHIGDKFYARGVADMKHFIAIAMLAGSNINVNTLKKPFSLCFTSDEEIGCLGARKLVKEDNIFVADNIIIGEPTDMIPVYAHKGYIYIRIELFGKGVHSSDPRKGISIVPALNEVINRISKIDDKLKTIIDTNFDPQYPTSNIGPIDASKTAKNITNEHCVLEMEVRPVPGQKMKDLFNAIKYHIGENIDDVRVSIRLMRAPSPPMYTELEQEIIQMAEELSGNSPKSVSFNTEGGLFNLAGAKSVIWGPGSINQAHKEDEYILDKYFSDSMIKIYEEAILRMCS